MLLLIGIKVDIVISYYFVYNYALLTMLTNILFNYETQIYSNHSIHLCIFFIVTLTFYIFLYISLYIK